MFLVYLVIGALQMFFDDDDDDDDDFSGHAQENFEGKNLAQKCA